MKFAKKIQGVYIYRSKFSFKFFQVKETYLGFSFHNNYLTLGFWTFNWQCK
jgi:hypothetical protein